MSDPHGMPHAYPLVWPKDWQRTVSRFPDRFGHRARGVSVNEGSVRVLGELSRLGVDRQDVVISSNIPLRSDGRPRSNLKPDARDPGVALYWWDRLDSGTRRSRCMAVDLYDGVGANLVAIANTLRAMRTIARHGGAFISDRVFQGFIALPGSQRRSDP